jgi:alanine racemase
LRPTRIEIDLSAIGHNVRQISKKVSPAEVMAVVKADAYGHGVQAVAQTAIDAGASYLAVALIEEAMELREYGISHPILVFGGELQSQIKQIIEQDVEITVFSRDFARELSRIALKNNVKCIVHVKVDTGMGRVGIPWRDAVAFIRDIISLEGIEIKGIYTHFSTSDERDKEYANQQLNRFDDIIRQLDDLNVNIPLKHAANSGAILDMPDAYFDMVRPGVMMYGYYPSPETTESVALKQAMCFKSKVSFVKDVPGGTAVSYGRKYVTGESTRIATIPVGYADGYNRLLSNRGKVIINGHLFPVAGRVCMDQILIDVGTRYTVEVGDDVILFGGDGEKEFSVYDICELVNTIPYEVCCWISKRVPRVYL